MARSSDKRHWEETKLYEQLKLLESADAVAARRLLGNDGCMPTIQRVLDQGGTALPDFTLHDAAHAFRVAERMAEVIPPDVLAKLSGYELALLLLSAYLHDIGMTPERKKVTGHYRYLLSGDHSTLTDADVQSFQRWLDDDERGIEPPLSKGTPTNDELELAEQLITYYCRERHNDWSREWIESHLQTVTPALYLDWTRDLATLCCSHHEGYRELRGGRFDPILKGPLGLPVQLRYLACVLRVADILEFDPERTPDVIFQHRAIAPGSRIYWAKDHALSFQLSRSGASAHIALVARLKDAYLHRAIEQTVEGVNNELETCSRLSEETHFEKCPHHPGDLPHRWDLPVRITPDIRPQERTYEYIDGAFRPNTSKVLALLSGVEMYKDPIVAVRELLQNALDSVREKIARERLDLPDPLDETDVLSLRKRYEVSLKLEVREDEYWLVCKDNGVGMSKALIRDHLLVSGATRRHDLIELERKCKKAGFSVGRTGQFGIGVLSYFMLANRVVIHTCRDANIDGVQEGAWRFETVGIGRFGELRPVQRGQPGTEVRLQLRQSVARDLKEWAHRLENYLHETLIYLPSRFSLNRPDGTSWKRGPGWVIDEATLARIAFSGLNRLKEEAVRERRVPRESWSMGTTAHVEGYQQEIDEVIKEARACLRWKSKEVILPDGLGRVRVHLPYFELPQGNSLGFLRMCSGAREPRFEVSLGRDIIIPTSELQTSWKGMCVTVEFSYRTDQTIVEVDLVDSSTAAINVNRFTVQIESSLQTRILFCISETSKHLLNEFLTESRASIYATLNHALVGVPITSPSPLHWATMDGNVGVWEQLQFPLADPEDFYWQRHARRQGIGRQNARAVFFAARLRASTTQTSILWHAYNHTPDRIVLHKNPHGVGLTRLWLDGHDRAERTPLEKSLLISEFPPYWDEILAVTFRVGHESMVLNCTHPITQAIDLDALHWLKSVDYLWHSPDREILMSSRARAAAWLIDICRRGVQEVPKSGWGYRKETRSSSEACGA